MARLNLCPICGGEATGQFCKGDTLQFAYEHCGICGGYRNDWKAARIAWNKTAAEWISAKGGKKVDRHTATECAYKNGFAAGMKAAEEKIVHCKECKFYGDEDDCPLLSLAHHTEPNDFCSCGERREDG
jgi:hypothetical protein